MADGADVVAALACCVTVAALFMPSSSSTSAALAADNIISSLRRRTSKNSAATAAAATARPGNALPSSSSPNGGRARAVHAFSFVFAPPGTPDHSIAASTCITHTPHTIKPNRCPSLAFVCRMRSSTAGTKEAAFRWFSSSITAQALEEHNISTNISSCTSSGSSSRCYQASCAWSLPAW